MGESRQELLAWLNEYLQLSPPLAKIEQLGTGALFCQLLDSIYGDVRLDKVKFEAKLEFEFINNFKVLQESFTKHNVDKMIPVDRLVKCKMQDNLEFCQWFKKFHDQHNTGEPYDAVGRRKGKGGAPPSAIVADKKPAAARATTTTTRTTTATAGRPPTAPAATRAGPTTRSTTTAATTRSSLARPTTSRTTATTANGTSAAQLAQHQAQLEEANAKITELELQNAEIKLAVGNLETERDFYFKKLRDIEIIIQDKEAALKEKAEKENTEPEPLDINLKQILNILYETDEGFEVPQAEATDETF